MKLSLPTVLSFTAGYVDSAGFLGLHGLFTAHVTGNLVMLGDTIARGSDDVIAKLLALPVFCLTILGLRYLLLRLAMTALRELRTLLATEILLLALAAAAALYFGHFTNPGGWRLIGTGMLLVAGMAVQNATHKLHLTHSPPTTLMTGSTTQAMLDFGSLLFPLAHTHPDSEAIAAKVRPRLWRLLGMIMAFALGCAGAALAVTQTGNHAFLVPPLLVLCGLLFSGETCRQSI